MVKVESIVYKNLNKDNILGDLKKKNHFPYTMMNFAN